MVAGGAGQHVLDSIVVERSADTTSVDLQRDVWFQLMQALEAVPGLPVYDGYLMSCQHCLCACMIRPSVTARSMQHSQD